MVNDVRARAERIRILFLDVDGVLTDAGMYYSASGEELKKFNTRDGMGLGLLREAGLIIAIITREESEIVRKRAAKLGIGDVYTGILDKLKTVQELLSKYGLEPSQAAFIGDDVNDHAPMGYVGLSVSVADAHELLRGVEHHRTQRHGGHGAVRELCDLILEAQGISQLELLHSNRRSREVKP